MTSVTTSQKITPLDILKVYPGSDLIPIEPPREDEDFQPYIDRVGVDKLRACGDTLLAFIILECASADGDPDEISHMMNTAIRDIVSVKNLADKRAYE